MKLEIVKQPIAKRPIMQECAELLCDVLDAAEKGLKVLPPRNKYGPGGLKNKGILMREHLMAQQAKIETKRDKKLQKISKQWKTELQQKEEEKQKLLEATKAERKAKRRQEYEKKKSRYQSIVKRNEERLKEREEKLKEINEKLKEQEEAKKAATKEEREKWKEEHREFLEKHREKLKKEIAAMVKEREELAHVQTEYEKKEKETVENVKGQVIKYFKENKEKLQWDKKEKEDVTKFIEKSAVKQVLEKYDVPLKYFFEFYSRSEHHGISFELDKHMETMNYKEFIRFGYQSNIVPALIPVEEMNHIYKLLIRERQDEFDNDDNSKLQVLDYRYFLKALVRIAAIAQDILGGQKGKKLEKRMEEIEQENQKTQKLRQSLAKKFKKGTETDKESDNSLDRGGETSGNDTDRKSKKDRPELYKRGAKKPRKKVIKDGFKDTTLKNAPIIKNVVSEAELLNRKSKNVNTMLKEGTKVEILEHLKKVKVEDKRVARKVDVTLITEKTIEALLNYLQLLPEDNKYSLDKKLNKVLRYNTGAKPNRLLKSVKPEKADAVDRGSSDDEKGNDSDKSPVTNKSKTEKSGQSDSDDDGNTTKN